MRYSNTNDHTFDCRASVLPSVMREILMNSSSVVVVAGLNELIAYPHRFITVSNCFSNNFNIILLNTHQETLARNKVDVTRERVQYGRKDQAVFLY